jgi:glutamate formiminotransferase/formiminotetrahydrofolate cyclodeaminase
MVANLSSHKRGWDDRWKEYSDWAEKGKEIQEELLRLVDEDTLAFNEIMKAFGMAKKTEKDKEMRKKAIQDATKNAILVPFQVMKTSFKSFELLNAMVETGNPNSLSDAGVGALAVRSGIFGAWLNVKINAKDLEDKAFVVDIFKQCDNIISATKEAETMLFNTILARL